MNISRLDLNLLKAVVAIYEEGSLTAAAERLRMTQPGLSHLLRRARAELDDPLFTRSTSGMTPTARTEALYPALADGLARIAAAFDHEQSFDPRLTTRVIRLGVNDYGSLIVLPRLIRLLAAEAPAMTLLSRHAPNHLQANALASRRVDLVIGAHDTPPSGLRSRELFTEDAVGIADAGNDTLGDPVTLEAYARAPHVIMAPDGSDRSWVDAALAAQGARRAVAHVTPHFSALFELVAGGPFVSTAPRRMAAQLGAAERLRVFELPFPAPLHRLRLLWHPRDDADAGHAWLREAIGRVGAALDRPGALRP